VLSSGNIVTNDVTKKINSNENSFIYSNNKGFIFVRANILFKKYRILGKFP